MIETGRPATRSSCSFMWWIMMIAMMTPSASPMVLLYGRAYRHEQRQGKLAAWHRADISSFVLGYLLSWAAFSAIATGLQWGLERVGLIHQMMMWSINPHLLRRTPDRSRPLPAHAAEDGMSGSIADHPPSSFRRTSDLASLAQLRLGWKHGLYCLGCCWFLMALLFAGGIMNLVWIAGLAVFVLIEKVAPKGDLVARIAGVAMVVIGLLVAAGSLGN